MRSSRSRGDGVGWNVPPDTGPGGRDAPIPVLVVHTDEEDTVGERLGTDDRFDVVTVRSTDEARPLLARVDCVVSTVARRDGNDDLLDAVRAESPALPYVVFADSVAESVPSSMLAETWTTAVERDGPRSVELLAHRIEQFAGFRAATTAARRSRAAIDAARDGIAIVDPDGVVEFANTVYAMQVGTDRDEIRGSHWSDRYTDAEVDRLESSALPVVNDAWRWSGECVARRGDGGTVSLGTRIVRVADGSLVFVHEGNADS